MDYPDYQCFVEGLASEASKADLNARLLTTVLGLAGEAAECVELVHNHIFESETFDKDKFINECSDIMWYVALGATTLEIPLVDFINYGPVPVTGKEATFKYNIQFCASGLSRHAGKCADIMKKYLFHGKAYNKHLLIDEILHVVRYIHFAATVLETNIQEIVNVNVVKLKDRYKTGKFTYEEFMKKEPNEQIVCDSKSGDASS
jgi:NTP pyrophosphatase (non-canonical NTP hydrolase)